MNTLKASYAQRGKPTELGVEDRKAKCIQVEVVEDTTTPALQGPINKTHPEDTPLFTNEHSGYQGLTNHSLVKHSQKRWAASTALGESAHTNGIESFLGDVGTCA